MKHLIIKNIGIIKSIDIELKKINVIIGPQTLGKSTVLKIASFCSWVEKRIELSQTSKTFEQKSFFITSLIEFHKMEGYFSKESFLEYESDYMHFSYDYGEDKFLFNWKDKRWNYKRPKISYIPSERNLIAAIPNWFEVSMGRNNIRNFMTDWEFARKSEVEDLQILNLGVSYHYDKNTHKDEIRVLNDKYIDFTNASSGLQSLVPMYIFINYLYNLPKDDKKISNIAEEWSNNELLHIIYDELFKKKGKTSSKKILREKTLTGEIEPVELIYTVNTFGNFALKFSSPKYRDEFLDICNNYIRTSHCDIYLEEPENNLFPPTQAEVVDWLLDKTNSTKENSLMIATHSPYILTRFLSKNLNIGMFVTHTLNDGHSSVKSLTQDEQTYIYDYGIDAFFNLENLVED